MNHTLLNLTHPQKRILFNEIAYPNEDMSNVGFVFKLKVDVSIKDLQRMLNDVIKKYDALRIRILKDHSRERIVQYFEEDQVEKIDVIDCSHVEDVVKHLEGIHYAKIPLYENRLYYFAILKLKNNEKGLYMKFHHIISDGVTAQLIVKDLSYKIQGNDAYEKGAPSYKEFIEYEQEYLNSPKCEKDKQYWMNRLHTMKTTTGLSKFDKRYHHCEIEKIYYTFNKSTFEKITNYCQSKKISYFHLISAAMSIYFKQYKNEDIICMGRAIHNRKTHHFRKMGGMFVSTVPFVYQLNKEDTFNDMIEDIKLKMKKDMRHQEYPYDLMIKNIREDHECMNHFVNIQISETPELDNEVFDVMEQMFSKKWNSEMLILINPRNKLKQNTLEISINYLYPLPCKEQMVKFLNHIETILNVCIDNHNIKIGESFHLQDETEEYWKQAISKDFSKTSFFPTHVYQNNYQYKQFKIDVPTNTLTTAIEYSKSKDVSLLESMMAAFYILVYQYTFEDIIIIGTPIEYDDFIHILPIQMQLHEISYDALVKEFKNKMEKTKEYGNYSIEQLIKVMNISCDHKKNPFFNIVFGKKHSFESKKMDDLDSDIQFTIEGSNNEKTVNITYRDDIFTDGRIQRMAKRYIHILDEAIQHSNRKVQSISMLSPEEYSKITKEFSNEEKKATYTGNVIDVFEARVIKNPNNIAVVEEDKQVTYDELNKKVNRLAYTLMKFEIKKEDIIGVLLNNSIEYIISILAVMKVGCAALPIDPKNPQSRIQSILESSQAKGLIYNEENDETIDFNGFRINIQSAKSYSSNEKNPHRTFGSKNLAYIIYTSGSTGAPKGACIEHHSLFNFCQWHNKAFHIHSKDRTIKYASPGFDASMWEIFPFLLAGASIYISPDAIKLNFPVLNEFFEENGITVSFITTRVFEEFLELENHSLRLLLTGGDKLRRFKPQRYKLVNNYGPTENTIVSTYYFLENQTQGCIPIGKPIEGVSAWILDKNKNICPIDVAGELYLGGEGVSRGYLNREDLTKEKFVKHPLFPSQTLYRSGDLVRWLSDGNIEFIGRVDDQIQLRGLRIELGEIEAQLMKHFKMKNVSVILQDGGTDYEKICAYYVSKDQKDIKNLKEFLKDKLPSYMIPDDYQRLDGLPFNNNGKINKKKLPYIKNKKKTSTEQKLPTNQLENELLQLWNKVLEVNSNNITEHFFEAGGNSLLAAIMMSHIYEKYKMNIPLDVFYENPTIDGISKWIKNHPIQKKKRSFMVYNKRAGKNIFCFPSAFGNASEYFNLAKKMTNFKMYAFHLKSDYTIEDYVKEIVKIQKNGPYTFIGYSLGGILAFEAAKKMEQLGKKVSKIIMIDSYALDLKSHQQVQLLMQDLKENLEFDVTKIVNGLIDQVKNIDFESKIHVPIVNIRSQMNQEWSNQYIKGLPNILTTNHYNEYQGYGLHHEMLKEGFVDKNFEIIKTLL